MVRQARALRDKKGILGEREKAAKGKKLSEEVKQKVIEFYQDDSNSRILPGAKDFISVNTTEGKIHKQKRLVLCNLSELYEKWVTETSSNTNLKIGFSTFALLRPKWCVLAGASGTHTVCVCMHHQNPKLKLQAIDRNLKCSELMCEGVCSLENENCMMHDCQHCPGIENIKNRLKSLIDDSIIEIEYMQWITTDRCSLKRIIEPIDDFLEQLAIDLYALTTHHFISKDQAAYLNKLKEHLSEDEIIVQLDFSENFTYVTQDATQSSYFSNQQATLHPYGVYYKENGSI